MDSAHKAERPRLCGRGRSSLFSIYLTWLQYAANYHRDFSCTGIISGTGPLVIWPGERGARDAGRPGRGRRPARRLASVTSEQPTGHVSGRLPARDGPVRRRLLTIGPARFSEQGSNNWVVDGTMTTTGKPILANDPHRRTPYTIQYLFNIQRELMNNMVLEVGYLGSIAATTVSVILSCNSKTSSRLPSNLSAQMWLPFAASMSCPVILTRLPDFLIDPSRT